MDRFDRLLDGDATEFERSLLDAASDDAPSQRARMRTLAAMGAGASVAGSAHAAHVATLAATSAGGASKGTGTVSLVALLKWLGTGALAGSVVAAGVATVTTPGVVLPKRTERESAVPAVVTTPVATSRPASVTSSQPAERSSPAAAAYPAEPVKPVPASAPRAEKSAAPVAVADPEPAPLTTTGVVASPEAVPSSVVVAEVESLDGARAALAAGNPREALARIARHDAAFPTGILGPEAVVLRVRALVALGDRAQASAVAARFMASHPNTPVRDFGRTDHDLHAWTRAARRTGQTGAP